MISYLIPIFKYLRYNAISFTIAVALIMILYFLNLSFMKLVFKSLGNYQLFFMIG